MRIPLETGDRAFLIVAAVILAVTALAAVLLMPREDEEARSVGYPSSYSTASDGGKAAYLLLDELGYDIERWTSPPDQLPNPAEGVVLIIADPAAGISYEEKLQIENYARRGGRVILAGIAAASLHGETALNAPRRLSFGWQEFSARTPGPISRSAPRISMKALARWGRRIPDHVPYFGDDEGAVVVKSRLGDGDLVMWADSSPLTNHGLTRASNLALFLNSVGPPEETPVLWDEYFHGARADFWDYLGRTPVPWALAQFGLLFFTIVLTHGRRCGPLATYQEEPRLSPLEFVETVGDLYARKRATAGAVEVAYHRFTFLLARRLGVSPPASTESLVRALSERGSRLDAELIRTLRNCQATVRIGRAADSQAVALVRSLHDFTRRLRLGRIGG